MSLAESNFFLLSQHIQQSQQNTIPKYFVPCSSVSNNKKWVKSFVSSAENWSFCFSKTSVTRTHCQEFLTLLHAGNAWKYQWLLMRLLVTSGKFSLQMQCFTAADRLTMSVHCQTGDNRSIPARLEDFSPLQNSECSSVLQSLKLPYEGIPNFLSLSTTMQHSQQNYLFSLSPATTRNLTILTPTPFSVQCDVMSATSHSAVYVGHWWMIIHCDRSSGFKQSMTAQLTFWKIRATRRESLAALPLLQGMCFHSPLSQLCQESICWLDSTH